MKTSYQPARLLALAACAALPLSACARGAAPAAPAPLTAPSPRASLVAQARAAIGFSPDAIGQGVQLSGATSMLGAEHTVSVLISATGDVLTEIRGPLAVSRCMTGGAAWARDIGGETRFLHLGEHDEVVLQSLFVSGRWTDDPRLTLAASDMADQLTFALKDSPITGVVTLDPATHLVTGIEYSTGPAAKKDSIAFHGAIAFAGVTFPKTIEVHSANGSTEHMQFTGAAQAPTFIRSPYQPVFGYSDATFDAGKPATLELKRAKTGHLLCRPLINGKQFDWFFFDTGAGGAILTPEVVNELKLERFGDVPVNGIGGSINSAFVRAGTIELGPITMKDALATELDLSFVATAIGEKVSGIIGFNLLSRCIAEIDQKGGTISLYDPAAYRATAEAKALAWSPLITYERHPSVQASFEDHTGYFKLDTGAAGSSVAIHAPAVTKLKLLEGRDVRDTRVGGVGGMKNAKKGTLAWFDLGGHRTENVPATFATDSSGAFDDAYTIGNIGGDLMEPFVLVLDYQQERIAFKNR